MKKKLTLLTLLFGSVALMAFNGLQTDGDIIKVSVVHYEGGKVMVLDTSFSVGSGYSVEQFLLDNNLDPNNTEIIDADNLEGPFVHDMQHDVWFMDGGCQSGTRVIKTMSNTAGNNEFITREHKPGEGQDVKIMKKVGDDGEMIIQKWVNGEEVPAGEGDMLWIDDEGNEMQLDGDMIFIHEDGDKENSPVRIRRVIGGESQGDQPHMVKVIKQGNHNGADVKEGAETMEVEVEKTIGPDGEEQIQMWINGEEVNPADYEELLNPENGEGEIVIEIESDSEDAPDGETMEVEVEKSIGPDGEEVIQMWINGEEVDPTDHEDLLNPENGQGDIIIEIDYDGESPGEGKNNVFIFDGTKNGNSKSAHGSETMDVQVEKTIGPDGEEVIQMWINGEEVDPADHEDLLNPAEGEGIIQIEIETEDEFIFQGDEGMNEGTMQELMSGLSYTVAIVSHGGDDAPVQKSLEAKPEAIQKLQFSPNPNSGQFTLSFNLPEKGRTVVNIYDLQGKLVFEDNLGRFQGDYRNDIDISSAGSGTYILNVIQGQNKLAEKIIVQ